MDVAVGPQNDTDNSDDDEAPNQDDEAVEAEFPQNETSDAESEVSLKTGIIL
jgi:hypothetical protein